MTISNNQIGGQKPKWGYGIYDNLALIGQDGTYQAQRVGASVLLVGDSRTARSNFHQATSGNSVSGNVLTLGMSTIYVPVGSTVYIRNAVDTRLIGEWPVLSYTTSAITVQLDQDCTGATVGSPTVMLSAMLADTGIWAYANGYARLAKKPLSLAKNHGINGAAASTWVAAQSDGRMLIEHVLDANPSDRVFVDLGTNDAVATITAAAFAADMLRIYGAILAAGRMLDVGTPVFLDSGSAASNALLLEYAGFIREYAAQQAGVTLVDQQLACKDAGGNYAAAGVLAADNVHYAPGGARLCGYTYQQAIASTVPTATKRRPYRAADGYDVTPTGWNKIKNPLLSGSGGSRSGGTWTSGDVPDNWIVTITGGTVIATQVARASGIGFDYTINWTTSGVTNMLIEQDMTALLPPGTVITNAGIEIETNTAGSGHFVQPMLQITTASGEVRCSALRNAQTYANGGRWPTAGERIFYELPEGFVIPPDATDVDFTISLQSGAAGTQEVAIGMPQLETA